MLAPEEYLEMQASEQVSVLQSAMHDVKLLQEVSLAHVLSSEQQQLARHFPQLSVATEEQLEGTEPQFPSPSPAQPQLVTRAEQKASESKMTATLV